MQPPPPPLLQPPPDPALILFARGVIARLEVWPALRVAVEQGWGGPSSHEKRRWLASEIVDAFDADGAGASSSSSAAVGQVRRDAHAHALGKNDKSTTTPDAEYIALMLAQALEDEFGASFEDGSVEAVAADVVALWGAGEDVVREWERRAEGVRGRKVDVREVEGDEDEDDWEDEDSGEEGNEDEDAAPQLMMPADVDAAAEAQRPAKPKSITDEDGFTLVQKGRR
jgi:pre-rRNA-processing protein TSR2